MFGLVLALTTASLGSAFAYSNRDWMELREGLVDVRLPSVGLIRVPGMVRLRGEYDGGGTVFDLGRSSSRASHHAGDIVLTVSPPHSLSVGIVARDHSGRLEHHVLAIPREVARSMFVGATIVIGLGLALFPVGRVARYVSEVALLRMIDEHAEPASRSPCDRNREGDGRAPPGDFSSSIAAPRWQLLSWL